MKSRYGLALRVWIFSKRRPRDFNDGAFMLDCSRTFLSDDMDQA